MWTNSRINGLIKKITCFLTFSFLCVADLNSSYILMFCLFNSFVNIWSVICTLLCNTCLPLYSVCGLEYPWGVSVFVCTSNYAWYVTCSTRDAAMCIYRHRLNPSICRLTCVCFYFFIALHCVYTLCLRHVIKSLCWQNQRKNLWKTDHTCSQEIQSDIEW